MSTNARSVTLDLLQRYYAAFEAGDRATMLALLSDDVQHDINQGGRESGREAFRAFMERMDRCYEERLSGLTLFASDCGTRGAAEFTVHGRYLAADDGLPPAHGQRYELPAGAFFAVHDGRITRITMYYNLQDWIAQVAE
jgi:steroid delta-isomerase-like uncharacterized protein